MTTPFTPIDSNPENRDRSSPRHSLANSSPLLQNPVKRKLLKLDVLMRPNVDSPRDAIAPENRPRALANHMATSDLAVSIRGLSKSYTIVHDQEKHSTLAETILSRVKNPFKRLQKETFWALKDVSFDIKKGEVVGIIGRNGAGKSTLLKILSRITEPTAGQIELWGRVGSLLEVGTGFHPELTGRENVYLNGAILGMSKSEIRTHFDAIVDFAGVEKFLDTPVKRYSSGMYVRLAFAVAAHLSSDILIVDEVLAVGDAEFQKKCLGKMGDVAKGGRTVLFVSHNMNAVEQLCGSVVAMERGKVAAYGPNIRQIVGSYLSTDSSNRAIWENSEDLFRNPYFRPLRFYLGNENGDPVPFLHSRRSEVWIHIQAEIEEIDPALTIGYALFSEDGTCLYWSYQTDTSEQQWPRFNKGKVSIKSKLPTEFLNEGNYYLELIGGLHHRQWLFQPGVNAPKIVLGIQGGISDSPLYTSARGTVLAPILTWSVDVEAF